MLFNTGTICFPFTTVLTEKDIWSQREKYSEHLENVMWTVCSAFLCRASVEKNCQKLNKLCWIDWLTHWWSESVSAEENHRIQMVAIPQSCDESGRSAFGVSIPSLDVVHIIEMKNGHHFRRHWSHVGSLSQQLCVVEYSLVLHSLQKNERQNARILSQQLADLTFDFYSFTLLMLQKEQD